MRRIATGLLGIALVAFYMACSADAPAPTSSGTGGGPRTSPTASALQVRLFTSNANPIAGNCTLVQAIVSLNGSNVPDGTGVAFSSDFGFFEQNGNVLVSVTTQGGAATTALCSANPGLANVRASATVSGQTGTALLPISFQPFAQSGPFFLNCSPSNAPNTGGTSVTFNGGRFFGSPATTRVTFTAAGVTREALVTAVTATGVTVTTPAFPEALSPSVPVTVNVTLGTNTPSPVTLTIPNCFAFGTSPSSTPSVTSILPSSGPNTGSTRVSIIGSGFVAPLQVFFGQVEAQVVSISFNQIIVLTPQVTPGSPNLNAAVDVRVHEVTSGVDGTLTAGFRYTEKVHITAVSNNIQAGTGPFAPVTIFGNGFQSPVAVSLAGIGATVISVSATEVIVLPSPPFVSTCTDLTGPIQVVNIDTGDSDTTGASLGFTYLIAGTKPIISSITATPSDPLSGTTITITGAHLASVVTVTVGGNAVRFTGGDTGLTAFAGDLSGGTPPLCPPGVPVGTAVNVGGSVSVTLTTSIGCTASGSFQATRACIVPTPTPAPPTVTPVTPGP